MADSKSGPIEGKSESGITPKQFTDILKTTIEAAAQAFKERWNSSNPTNPVDIRFILHKHKVPNHSAIKAQAMLTMEIKRNFMWEVSSRTAINLTSVKQLEANENDYTFQLWSDMFAEVTQVGFVAILNYLHGKEANQHSTVAGDIPAVEDETV